MARTEINAITFVVTNMARSVQFYVDLGFALVYGGPGEPFSTLSWGEKPVNFVNLQHTGETPGTGWGRVIFFTPDPDLVYATALAAGHQPEFDPRDAPWNERYFHIRDPDGHELSFAVPLSTTAAKGTSDSPGDFLVDFAAELRKFMAERDWERFHTPKNLVMALAGEAGELLAEFQWLTAAESERANLSTAQLEAIESEMADVLIYLVRLADRLETDLADVARAKMAINAVRFRPTVADGVDEAPSA